MVTDPGNTFHFYRQNPDGTWSHKPGTLPITKLDADDLPIYTPYTSNRDYTTPGDDDPINYTEFCGYYCIPKNSVAKHEQINLSLKNKISLLKMNLFSCYFI